MVFTRSKIENLSREELIKERVKFSDITDRLKELVRLSCYKKNATLCYILVLPN